MSLTDSWQSFLDWCADKGLPFRDWAYALEDKGIPSLPVFIVCVALVVGIVALAVVPALPAVASKGKVRVVVTDLAGGQIAGAPSVTLTNLKTGVSQTVNAPGGIALFADVAPGDYEVSVVSPTLLITNNRQTVTVKGGETASLSFAGASASAELVSLYVTIRGADSAQITVYFESGVPVDSAVGASHEFRVEKNREYIVSATQEGYSPVEKKVAVASQNEQVTLVLVKNGVERQASLHVGVFDESGIEGKPVENASVRVIEATTQKTLYSLRSSQDGSCEAVNVLLGAELRLIAAAPGFESKTVGVNASSELIEVKIQLKRLAAAENSSIEVTEEAGAAVPGPLVRIFNSRNEVRFEQAPADGIAEFDVAALGGSSGLYATVYKPRFLPEILSSIRRGVNRVKLREATPQNSGTVRVLVFDKTGLPTPQATVTLLDAAKRSLGFPGVVTGEDGAVTFEGVPLGSVIAVASKGARKVESEVQQVLAGEEIEIQLQFLPQKTRFEAFVVEALTRKPITGAAVKLFAGGATASCTTAATGKCSLEAIESDAATAVVSATGYEDYASDEFRLVPGAKNKREFALAPLAAAVGKIYFNGIFDEDGKRASELKPLGVYTARFSLSGSEAARAVAHIRVGDAAKQLDEEPIEIISYSVAGGRVTRGVSYDELVAIEETVLQEKESGTATTREGGAGVAAKQKGKKSEIIVGVYDYGFVPQDVEVVEGTRVVFKNLGEKPHTVVFDQGFEGGAGSSSNVLQPNQTFIVTPQHSGSWSFHCGLHPQETGVLNVAPPTQAAQAEAKAASAAMLSGAEATAFKWVEFSFEPFKGRKEVSVRFKVKQRVGEKAWLEYRAAFYGEGGAGVQVLREPRDEAAGVSKPQALAETLKTKALLVKFGGVCENRVCLEYWFEQEGVRNAPGEFTAELGKAFKVGFHALTERDGVAGAVTLRLKAPAAVDAGGALALKRAIVGQKVVGVAAATENASELSIVLREAEAEGAFEVEAVRLSNDAELQLAALDSRRNTLLEQNAFVRVAASGAPRLIVSVKPTSLTALKEATLVFKIQNAFGVPLSECRVVVEPSEVSQAIISSVLEAQESTEKTKIGEYAVTGVAPEGAGGIEWRASCDGYAPANGVIDVAPP
ncbi:MAG: carboxypeptidase regulatory-like domain-containing protein, partial [Candidatus Norongarragalinales archaeon]